MEGLLPSRAKDQLAPVRGDALGGSSAVALWKDWSEQGTSQRGPDDTLQNQQVPTAN